MTGRQGRRKHGGPRQRRIGIGAALVALALALLLLPNAAAAQAPAPTLTTDKADYAPGEVVHLSGTGYEPGGPVRRPGDAPHGDIVTIDPLTHVMTPGWHTVTADPDGNLVYDYQLNGVQGSYEARVYPASWTGDWSETPVASATFTDASSGIIDQCRKYVRAPGVHPSEGAWVTGNAGRYEFALPGGPVDSLPRPE